MTDKAEAAADRARDVHANDRTGEHPWGLRRMLIAVAAAFLGLGLLGAGPVAEWAERLPEEPAFLRETLPESFSEGPGLERALAAWAPLRRSLVCGSWRWREATAGLGLTAPYALAQGLRDRATGLTGWSLGRDADADGEGAPMDEPEPMREMPELCRA